VLDLLALLGLLRLPAHLAGIAGLAGWRLAEIAGLAELAIVSWLGEARVVGLGLAAVVVVCLLGLSDLFMVECLLVLSQFSLAGR
jgi:hypothetical protein